MNDGDQNLGWDDAKSGGFTLHWPPCLRKSGVGGNSQLGATSSIGSQAGSRSPDEKVMSDIISLLVFLSQFWHLLLSGRRAEIKTFACYFRRTLCPSPHFPIPDPPRTSLYSNQTSTSLPLPQHKCTGSKLDRNCGKKGEKQMQPLCSTSSRRKRYTAT